MYEYPRSNSSTINLLPFRHSFVRILFNKVVTSRDKQSFKRYNPLSFIFTCFKCQLLLMPKTFFPICEGNVNAYLSVELKQIDLLTHHRLNSSEQILNTALIENLRVHYIYTFVCDLTFHIITCLRHQGKSVPHKFPNARFTMNHMVQMVIFPCVFFVRDAVGGGN